MTLVFLRILLSLIIFLFIVNQIYDLAFYLFGLTALIAFFDGFLAKRNRVKSQLRSIFDPFADKLLINLTSIALYLTGMLPLWVLVTFLIKDSLVVFGAIFVLVKNIKTTFRSSVVDKVSVFIQIITLLSILMERSDYFLIWMAVTLALFSLIITLFRSGVVTVSKRTDLEDLRFKKLVKLPDYFTFLNLFMGLSAILFAINKRYNLSILALLLAVLFDYLDGKIARLIKRQGEFGKQLDSLSDTVSFGIAPAIFAFTLIKTPFALIMFTIFLFAGVLRLARYNIMEFSGDYAGMPITVNGVILPLVYIFNTPYTVYPYIYLFLAILMVSPVKFKKIF